MTLLAKRVQQYSASCERLLEVGTVLSEDEQNILLFYAAEITRAVREGTMNITKGRAA
jgi:hypothetical protein